MSLKEKSKFKKFLKEAKKGKPMYQANIGQMYLHGKGVDCNYQEAFYWFKQATEQQYGGGYYGLAVLYENGYGVNKDLAQSLEWYKKAEQSGYPESTEAVLRVRGQLNTYANPEEWFETANKLFTKNSSSAAVDSALLYYIKAAEAGHVLSQDKLGYIYLNEEYNRNYSRSYEWSLKAAIKGNANSQYRVGLFTEKGIYGTVTASVAEAKKWYEKAAAQGNSDATAALKRLATSILNPVPAPQTGASKMSSAPATRSVETAAKSAPAAKVSAVRNESNSAPVPEKQNIDIDVLVMRIERAVESAIKETFEKGDGVNLMSGRKILGSPLKNKYGEIACLSRSVITFRVIGYEKIGDLSVDHYIDYQKFSNKSNVYTYGLTSYQLSRYGEIMSTRTKEDAEEADKRAKANSGWHKFKQVADAAAKAELAKYNPQGRYKSKIYPIKSIEVDFIK